MLLWTAAAAQAQDAAGGATDAASAEGADAAGAEAQALFRRGLELAEQNRWADALEHFRRSHARVERPSTLYNIGLALVRLGRFVEALDVLDRVLAEAGLPVAARQEAERLRTEASASLGEVTLSLSPADAVVYVDGVERVGSGPSRAIPLDPGRHVLRATARGHDEAELVVSVVAGEHGTEELVLAPQLLPDADPLPPSTDGGDLWSEPWLWIVGGVVVVVGGVGIGVGVALANDSPPPYGGTTGVVLLAP